MNKTISPQIIALTFGVLVICFAVAFYVVAWTEPTQAPPGGNVPTPLNIGSVGQSKAGGLILNTGGAANGLIIQYGNVGIGTTAPWAKLEISSSTAGNTADVMQRWKWNDDWYLSLEQQHVSGSHLQYNWIQRVNKTDYNVLSFKNANVGIGTASPGAKLEVFNPSGSSVVKVHSDWDIASINIDSISNSYGAGINLLYGGAQTWFIGMPRLTPGGAASNNIYFSTSQDGTGAKMVITSGGNVGIGTTDPGSYKLNVNGDIHGGYALKIGTDLGFETTANAYINTNTNGGTINIGSGVYAGTSNVNMPGNLTTGGTVTVKSGMWGINSAGDLYIDAGNTSIGTTYLYDNVQIPNGNLMVNGYLLQKPKTLFFTQDLYQGNLEGIAGANARCSTMIPGSRMAYSGEKGAAIINPGMWDRGWVDNESDNCYQDGKWTLGTGGLCRIHGQCGRTATLKFESYAHDSDALGRGCEGNFPILCVWPAEAE